VVRAWGSRTFRCGQGRIRHNSLRSGLREVEKVDSNLVVRDADGKAYTVRYEAMDAMLLNEFLKEHRKGQEQEAMIAQLKSAVAQQQQEIRALTAGLKKQASQIEKVSAQVEMSKSGARVVAKR
jgi:uncharacterized coiled-coil protein SlyX